MLLPFPYVYIIDGLVEGLVTGRTICVIVTVIVTIVCAWLMYYMYIFNYNKCLIDAQDSCLETLLLIKVSSHRRETLEWSSQVTKH